MTENNNNFNNLAQKMTKLPSKMQILKEYLMSFFGGNYVDENFLKQFIKTAQETSDHVENILKK